ncbi:helix-turn-helix domain-containing protein [Anaeromassilibacillus senegalensis]|uniref:helix-turn-helix domain-containing protein n=1 Tax=Anaeromassilibacillus senegalensis TaxID=1673717 RepID=UPI0006826A94
MIIFNRLFELLPQKGHSTYTLRKNGISANTINRMRNNEAVTTKTIDELCNLLDCKPEEIMEHITIKQEK